MLVLPFILTCFSLVFSVLFIPIFCLIFIWGGLKDGIKYDHGEPYGKYTYLCLCCCLCGGDMYKPFRSKFIYTLFKIIVIIIWWPILTILIFLSFGLLVVISPLITIYYYFTVIFIYLDIIFRSYCCKKRNR